MTRVVVDTNALMMPVELDVRLFDELDRLLGSYETVVPRAVLAELENLAVGGSEEADGSGWIGGSGGAGGSGGTPASEETVAARVGRDLAERCTVADHDASYADDAVLEVARECACDCVVTSDRPLRERLLGESVPVISLRGRNKLELTQP